MSAIHNAIQNTRHSAIYRGQVRHRRFRDAEHAFTYPLAMLYLDLAELPALFDGVPCWSARRPAAGWFREQDYLAAAPGKTLRERVNRTIHAATGHWPTGPVRLLTNPRYAGLLMNPISCFFCFADDGVTLQFMVAEVTNTPWRERIAYVLPCEAGAKQQCVRFAKQMHVSPFNPMAMDYVARFNTPGHKLYLHLENHCDGSIATDATLTLTAQPLDRRHLLQLLWQFPLQSLQVAAGIYWQALRLWLRGARFHHHPSSHEEIHS